MARIANISDINGRCDSPFRLDRGSPSSGGSTPKSDAGCGPQSAANLGSHSSGFVLCAWCGRVCESGGPGGGADGAGALFSLATTSGERHFCSEVCFTQCRRASFKKSKVCDWCRNVRPTVTYVDFTDGDHQLQFCSDKCLNQYKMHIFCRETEAHLQLHPHLNDLKDGGKGGLITPDLWLKGCSDSEVRNVKTEINSQSNDQLHDPLNIQKDETIHSSADSSLTVHSHFRTNPTVDAESAEPVNLSKQASLNGTSHSPSDSGHEILSSNSHTQLPSTSRHGRMRLRTCKTDLKESPLVDHQQSNIQSQEVKHSSEMEDKPKGAIRVRQLEDQIHYTGRDREIASPPPDGTNSLVGISGLGGLLMGSHPPLIPGLPPLLPPPPADLPRPPLLPNLLLSHPELLHLPGLRPPLLLPQPPPHAIPHPQQPQCLQPPAPHASKLGFLPPVTVLLPIPIPVPVPIPIPIPLPIPSSREQTESGINSNSSNVKKKDETPKETQFQHERREENALSARPNKIPESSIRMERERRSILKYTSDVYEISGVSVPARGSWASLQSISPDNTERPSEVRNGNDNDCLTSVEEAKPKHSSRKRQSESEFPLPKKKHLLA